VDDTDAAVAVTFFFTTDGKSFVPTFNCSIRNRANVERRPFMSSSVLLRQPNATSSMGVLNMGRSGEGGGTGNDAAP
jgi:hypothetical protein